jgi:succinate dehydrogenase (ubiquinone) flavoprotein subunit
MAIRAGLPIEDPEFV